METRRREARSVVQISRSGRVTGPDARHHADCALNIVEAAPEEFIERDDERLTPANISEEDALRELLGHLEAFVVALDKELESSSNPARHGQVGLLTESTHEHEQRRLDESDPHHRRSPRPTTGSG